MWLECVEAPSHYIKFHPESDVFSPWDSRQRDCFLEGNVLKPPSHYIKFHPWVACAWLKHYSNFINKIPSREWLESLQLKGSWFSHARIIIIDSRLLYNKVQWLLLQRTRVNRDPVWMTLCEIRDVWGVLLCVDRNLSNVRAFSCISFFFCFTLCTHAALWKKTLLVLRVRASKCCSLSLWPMETSTTLLMSSWSC